MYKFEFGTIIEEKLRLEESSRDIAQLVRRVLCRVLLRPPTLRQTMPKSEDNQDKPRTFKIIAGSYEKLLYGLEGTIIPHQPDEEYTFDLNPIFIFPAHVSCIKAVAASPMGGKWLATGSGDEIVKVWDLRRKKEVGGLMHHEGN